MTQSAEPKPIVDAVNDAIGALSELLRALRAKARQHAASARPSSRKAKRSVAGSARKAVRTGKRVAKKAKAAGVAFIRGAESALRDFSEQSDEQGRARAGDGSHAASRPPRKMG